MLHGCIFWKIVVQCVFFIFDQQFGFKSISLILLHIHIHIHQISPKLSWLATFPDQFARRGTWVTFTKVQIENCLSEPTNGCTEVALFFCIQATAVSAPTFETHLSSPPLHCVLVKIHCNAHRQLLKRPWPVYRGGGGIRCINGLWRGHRQTFEEKNFNKKPFLVLLFIFSKQFFSEPFRADFRIHFNFAAKLEEERQLVAGD